MEQQEAQQKVHCSPFFWKASMKVCDWHLILKKVYSIPFDTDICRVDAY